MLSFRTSSSARRLKEDLLLGRQRMLQVLYAEIRRPELGLGLHEPVATLLKREDLVGLELDDLRLARVAHAQGRVVVKISATSTSILPSAEPLLLSQQPSKLDPPV